MKIKDLFFGSRRAVVGWNTLAQFIGKIASVGVMFLISLLIARRFGAKGFGDFTKITTYIAFYYLLADFGLNAIYLQKEQKSENNLGSLIVLRLSGSLVLILLSLAILFILPQGTIQGYTGLVRLGIILYSPTILFQALITTANALFQKHLRYELATLALVIGDLVSLILILLIGFLVSTGSGSVAASTSLAIGVAITAVISLVLLGHLAGPLKISHSISEMRKFFLAGLPLGIMLIFNQVYFRFDSFIITLTRSTTEVGIYGLAYKIFEMPLVLPTFFMNSLYPLMLTIKSKEVGIMGEELKLLVKKSFTYLVLMSFMLLAFFWITAPLLTLIRPEFSLSIEALRILVISLPIFFVTSLLMWLIVVLEKQKVLPIVYGLSMIFIIITDIFFIPRYGYIAAAWITVAGEGVVLILLSLLIFNFLKSHQQIKL